MRYRAVQENKIFGKLTRKARQTYDKALDDLDREIRDCIHSYKPGTWNATLDDGITVIEGNSFYIEQLVAGRSPQRVGVRRAD